MKHINPSIFRMTPVAAVLLLALNAQAQTAGALPTAGTLMQQAQPGLTATAPTTKPGLQLPAQHNAALPASEAFLVKQIRIEGNTAFATATLQALVQDSSGRPLTLPQLAALAARITTWYQQHGYPLSRAIVPAQRIENGSVLIQVLEARYGALNIVNRSSVDTSLLNATLAPLVSGAAITSDKLDTSLLLLSDIPGIGVQGVLKPGTLVGTSDLDVITTPNPPAVADLTVDNFGNHYTGRARISGGFTFANPLRHGDLLNIGLATSGEGMQYGRLSYEAVISGSGTRVGASLSQMHYKLGEDVTALDAHGSASVASLWLRQPLLRQRDVNVYAQLGYDSKRVRDRIDLIDSRNDRALSNWNLSLNGDWHDANGGAFNAWSLSYARARTSFDNATALLLDATSARTAGHASKWNASFAHQHLLTAKTSFNLNLTAQWANRNLDSAEKISVGGPYSVRGVDVGSLSGDSGLNASIELRRALCPGWQGSVFVDSARVKVNQQRWSMDTNSVSLHGAGVGLQWQGQHGWRANGAVAAQIGGEPALAGAQSSVRAWVSVSKAF